MESDEEIPKIKIGGKVGGNVVVGNNNIVNAPKPFNNKGIFMPAGHPDIENVKGWLRSLDDLG